MPNLPERINMGALLSLWHDPVSMAYIFAYEAAQANSQESNTVGAFLQDNAISQQLVHYNNGSVGVLAVVTGEAAASTNFGINRISVAGGFAQAYDHNGPSIPNVQFIDGFAAVSAVASSAWRDGWTITGGVLGSQVLLTISGEIDFGLSGTVGFLGNPAFNNFSARQTFESPTGTSQLAGTSDFIASASTGRILWSRTISVASGTTFQVGETLTANVSGANVRNYAEYIVGGPG